MESLRWMLGLASGDGGDDGAEPVSESPSPIPATPPAAGAEDDDDSVPTDWCVVVEECSRLRTVDIADVHQQRVRSRPRLARWAATEDALIERPLQIPLATAHCTYAHAARPTYAQILKLEAAARAMPPLVLPDDDAAPVWMAVTRKMLGPAAAPHGRMGTSQHLDVDWLDVCAATRVGRRFTSRTFPAKQRGHR